MKKIILTILIIFTAFSVNISAEELSIQKNTISISFDFSKKLRLASNQFAVWVENEKGMLVKNLFVTDFTARKGWEKRPESLPSWRKNVKDTDIDGISSVTPKSGKIQLQWDIKNENEEPVEKVSIKSLLKQI